MILYPEEPRSLPIVNFGNILANTSVLLLIPNHQELPCSHNQMRQCNAMCKFSSLVIFDLIKLENSMDTSFGNPISIPTLFGKDRLTMLCDNAVTIVVTDLYVTIVP